MSSQLLFFPPAFKNQQNMHVASMTFFHYFFFFLEMLWRVRPSGWLWASCWPWCSSSLWCCCSSLRAPPGAGASPTTSTDTRTRWTRNAAHGPKLRFTGLNHVRFRHSPTHAVPSTLLGSKNCKYGNFFQHFFQVITIFAKDTLPRTQSPHTSERVQSF